MPTVEATVVQQVGFCLDKCPHNEIECYQANIVGEIQWVEERTVVHVCADGSQWLFTSREGVQMTACPLMGTTVKCRVFQATCECRVLQYVGQEILFIGKPYVDIIYHNDSDLRTHKLSMRKPVFGLWAVLKSWDEFTTLVEAQAEDRTALAEFVTEDVVCGEAG